MSKGYLERLEAMNGKPLQHKPAEINNADRGAIARQVEARFQADVAALRRKMQPRPASITGAAAGSIASRQTGYPAKAGTSAPRALVFRRDLPHVAAPVPRFLPQGRTGQSGTQGSTQSGTQGSAQSGTQRCAPLHELVPGSEIHREGSGPGSGRVYLVAHCADDVGPGGGELHRAYRGSFAEPGVQQRLRDLCGGRCRCMSDGTSVGAEDLIFLDLETTGLGSSPLFLGGIAHCDGTTLHVTQYLARDYSEEAAVTALLVEALQSKKVLVTFNGKSFDLPYLRMRCAANGVHCALHVHHLDVLHEARRTWRGAVPDCRLKTLEQHICGRSRHDDIPGSEIPAAYHDFVRSGDASQIASILHHNMLDLLTLVELLIRLPG